MRRAWVVAGVVVLALPVSVRAGGVEAQDGGTPVRIAVHPVAPFVIEDADGDLSGFSVELARAIAEKADLTVEFLVVDSVGAQLAAIEAGEAEAAIGAISITADREFRVDFSHPTFDSGIQIATRDHSSGSVLDGWWPRLFNRTMLVIFLVAVLGTLVVGSVIWRLERRRNGQFRRDGKGVLDGVWWATENLFSAVHGDKVPLRGASRALATLWMLVSVLLVAGLIAQVTSNATVERLEADVQSLGDLQGRDVVVIAGTSSSDFLTQNGVVAEPVGSAAEGLAAVGSGEADAYVGDSAILRHLVGDEGGVSLVNPVLRAEQYAVAVASGSDVLEPINRALLRLRETGTIDRLVSAYFG